jgi:hypothetical protein
MPNLFPFTGSDRNATVTTIYMLQMPSVCDQTKTQVVFLTHPVNSFCFTLRHNDTYVMFPYLLWETLVKYTFLSGKKCLLKESSLFYS